MTATLPDSTQAFLNAIRGLPTDDWQTRQACLMDDAPRLIFADWLDEHGQAERAEFIRVQCELSRMPNDKRDHATTDPNGRGCLDCKIDELLRRRERELWKENWGDWTAGIHSRLFHGQAGEFGVGSFRNTNGSYKFSRGFLAHVSAPLGVLRGEVCRACEEGEVVIREYRMVEYTGEDCPICHGTGRTPGVLRDIVRSEVAAVEYVEATDRRPFCSNKIWYWIGDSGDQWGEAVIHKDLFDSMEPFPVNDNQEQPANGPRGFDSEAAARAALSRALLEDVK